MAKVLVSCCERCGASIGVGDWVDGRLHRCDDDVMGGIGQFDIKKKPRLRWNPPVSLNTPATGECPNCRKALGLMGGNAYCPSCGALELEPKTFMVKYPDWVHANDTLGWAFLQTIKQTKGDISYIFLDPTGIYMTHQLKPEVNQSNNETGKHTPTRSLRPLIMEALYKDQGAANA